MVYEFVCLKCKKKVVVSHSLTSLHPATHEGCGGDLRRSFNVPNIVYKGSGFFQTDKALYPKQEEA